MFDDLLTVKMLPEDARELRLILLRRPHSEVWSERVLNEVVRALANSVDEPPPENPVILADVEGRVFRV